MTSLTSGCVRLDGRSNRHGHVRQTRDFAAVDAQEVRMAAGDGFVLFAPFESPDVIPQLHTRQELGVPPTR